MEKRIKMTNKDIDDSLTILGNIANDVTNGVVTVEDPKFSYFIGRNIRLLKSENDDYVNERNKALREYGEYFEDEKGNSGYRINIKNDDQSKAYENRMRNISGIEHEITVFAVPLKTFKEWNLPFAYQAALWFLAEEDESSLFE